MEQRHVGKSGLRVSSVGLGCNNFGWTVDPHASREIIHRALDLGVTLYDTAPVYGPKGGESEEILGAALGTRRKDVAINTKFGLVLGGGGRTDTSRAAIMTGIEESLRRLKTDYVDIYMLHFPDESTPMEETLRALDDIVRQGKARYIACSNMTAWRLVEARWISRTEHLAGFIVSQNEYNLVQREADRTLLPALREYGVGLMPYAPLANGLLTGKYAAGKPAPEGSRLGRNMWRTADRYLTEARLAMTDRLGRFAAGRGRNLVELAICWQLSNPLVCSVIAGATTVEQVEANVAADSGWRLDAEELAEVDRLCKDQGKKA